LGKHISLIEEGLSRSNVHIYIVDPQARFLYLSAAAARSIGRSPEEIIGRTGRDIGLPEDAVGYIERTVRSVIEGGCPVHGEITGQFKGQGFAFEYDATPLGREEGNAVMAVVSDRSLERRGNTLLEALNDINLQISDLADPEAIMNKVVDLAGAAMGGDPLALVLRDGGKWTLRHVYALPLDTIGQQMAWAEALTTGAIDLDAPWVIDDARSEPRLDQATFRSFDVRSLLSVPVRVRGELAACIVLLRQGHVRPYSKDEVEFARKLANSMSVALSSSALHQETKRADAEKAALLVQLASEKEVLRAMMEMAPVVIALFEGEEPRLVLGNAYYRRSIGPVGDGPLEGRLLKDMVDEEEYRQDMALVRRVRETGRPIVNEEYLRHPPGAPTQYCQISLLPLERTVPRRVLMVSSNVTATVQDKKRIEELALRADGERRRLRAILDTMPVGVVIVDSEGQVLESNELRDRIWGAVPKDRPHADPKVLRGRWADTGLNMAAADWPVNRALRNGERTLGLVVDIKRLDGSPGTALVSAAPIVNEAGERIGAVGVQQDITEQRRLEHEAVEAKERAELYLDLLTHDVNNINTAISGFILLAMGGRTDQRNDYHALALESITESSRLIENVQKLVRVEASSDARNLIDLGLVIEEVIDEQLKRPDNHARIGHRPQLRRFVFATELIRDVFTNLIGNAVKHADGPVNIYIALLRAFEGGREFHQVVIEDDGPGIGDAMKAKVFVRQFRGPGRTKGSGLGLYLVKKLVEDYGGRVWVEDRVPGDHTKGAKFVVLLPAATPSPPNAGRM
jgi:PAS domain S-box-containing protein